MPIDLAGAEWNILIKVNARYARTASGWRPLCVESALIAVRSCRCFDNKRARRMFPG
jgi:hypothetical protein